MTAHVACVLALAAATACAREPPIAPIPATTSATIVHGSTIDAITTVRCHREQACDNVGPGRKYASFNACSARLTPDSRAVARLQACAKGIKEDALATCLEDIRTESCTSPLDTIDPLASCNYGLLCR
jgi:hypothetical protein